MASARPSTAAGPRYVVIGTGIGFSPDFGIDHPAAGSLEALLCVAPGPVRFIPTLGMAASEKLPIGAGSAKNLNAAAAPAPASNTAQLAINPPIIIAPTPAPWPVINIVSVPDCFGMTQTGCDAALTAQGLHLGTVTFLAPQTPPPYIGSHVVSQSPAAGRLVWRGSSVNISVQPFGPPFRP